MGRREEKDFNPYRTSETEKFGKRKYEAAAGEVNGMTSHQPAREMRSMAAIGKRERGRFISTRWNRLN